MSEEIKKLPAILSETPLQNCTKSSLSVQDGYPFPYGATEKKEGINFALFSKNATKVSLSLFYPGGEDPFAEITLDPKRNKTGNIWHILISNLPDLTEYAYRIDGPFKSEKGHLFDSSKFLSDPYTRSFSGDQIWGCKGSYRSQVIRDKPFDWQGTTPPRIPMKDLIIYEMHVRCFTKDASSNVSHPGTFLGVVEKIPHLKALGINAVELMPVFEFNECEYNGVDPFTNAPLFNLWGYSSMSFFAPMKRFATSSAGEQAILEFKTMVRELHKNGIEVILDVVFNHTAEGGKNGPYLSFRGIDNAIYYQKNGNGEYLDFTGCGNTFNCQHPVVTNLIIDSLRYWAYEMHVDGFRFDLASILTRGEHGEVLTNPPLINAISKDPLLANIKLIAEAWDAVGLYQVGHFPHQERWADWNGIYRDSLRDFIKGSGRAHGNFARAFCGSEELYKKSKAPSRSINFVTAHDGFSLRDLVSYNEKHNEANGEENRDGNNDNRSWNCGIEGTTDLPEVLELRERQMRNFHLALMLSLGTPMILMGDEYGHTRNGNNNTWCQDNKLSWFLWDELEKKKEFFSFWASLIAFRKERLFKRDAFFAPEDIDWHGVLPLTPEWDQDLRFIACTLKRPKDKNQLYVAFNAQYENVKVQAPPPPEGKKWVKIIDTTSNQTFINQSSEAPLLPSSFEMISYSALVAEGIS